MLLLAKIAQMVNYRKLMEAPICLCQRTLSGLCETSLSYHSINLQSCSRILSAWEHILPMLPVLDQISTEAFEGMMNLQGKQKMQDNEMSERVTLQRWVSHTDGNSIHQRHILSYCDFCCHEDHSHWHINPIYIMHHKSSAHCKGMSQYLWHALLCTLCGSIIQFVAYLQEKVKLFPSYTIWVLQLH